MTETLSPALTGEIEQRVEQVLAAACQQEVMLATAESCTGGLLASLLTDVEGRSHAFDRGFVTYTDEAKHELLGVSRETLGRFGAVSETSAREMAEGAIANSQATLAVSITGFAGAGGPDDEPGLVHFAIAERDRETRHVVHHFGDLGRGPVRVACLETALDLFAEALEARAGGTNGQQALTAM